MNSVIKVAGNIISELSERIPSNIIALNELLKNSYDAGATEAAIYLDTANRLLTIKDNGEGMNKEDIDKLFHISYSEKQYGKINKYGRYTQGSKGLGFLSVFKFGKNVTWHTKKDKGLRFSVDFNQLIGSDDISTTSVELVEDDSIENGTFISISLDSYNAPSLEEYFAEERNYKKILNSFYDSAFKIIFTVNGVTYRNTETRTMEKNAPEYAIYRVKYQSHSYDKNKTGDVSEIIQFIHNDNLLFSIPFSLPDRSFKLYLDLIIYHLPPHGKGKIDQLYTSPDGDLSPLLYVNDNLFNNFSLFNTNIMKNVKTASVLNQMIGYIRIISDDSMILFNSDRSQFSQNEVTDRIAKFLAEINIAIQENGAKNKKYLLKHDYLINSTFLPTSDGKVTDLEYFRKYIASDFLFSKYVSISKRQNWIIFTFCGKEKSLRILQSFRSALGVAGTTKDGENDTDISGGNKSNKGTDGGNLPTTKPPTPAAINLNQKYAKFAVPSKQIDLKDYIASAFDSNGDPVEKKDISISADSVLIHHGILPSQTTPSTIKIFYLYDDMLTKKTVTSLDIEFYQPQSSVIGKSSGGKLISLPTKGSYAISYSGVIADIINQVNKLSLTDYLEVVSCSLRAVLEISIDVIKKSTKFNSTLTFGKDLEDNVVKVIEYVKDPIKKCAQHISQASGIDYQSLLNLLDSTSFRSSVATAHLGAHKATTYIVEKDVAQLAQNISIFVVIVNEMMVNPKIN